MPFKTARVNLLINAMAYQDKISEVNNTLGVTGKCETASNFKKTIIQNHSKTQFMIKIQNYASLAISVSYFQPFFSYLVTFTNFYISAWAFCRLDLKLPLAICFLHYIKSSFRKWPSLDKDPTTKREEMTRKGSSGGSCPLSSSFRTGKYIRLMLHFSLSS